MDESEIGKMLYVKPNEKYSHICNPTPTRSENTQHIEYIDGIKYEWKPGHIPFPQSTNLTEACPPSPNYFECLDDNDDPPTVEPTSSRTDDSQPPAEATKSQAKRVSEKATKKKVEFASEVVTEVRTRPRFENEKELSQPKEEEIQNRRATKCCRHLLNI